MRIPEFLRILFDTSDFTPRWVCGHWTALHGWTHIASDVAIWGAYTAIPLVWGSWSSGGATSPSPDFLALRRVHFHTAARPT